ncbi:hypothetical protein O3Q52_06815 [Streptomyces sp. ActVer]|uniref:hypothetical protein n=1 Tax=Streptomyces sp. ActVer TaxID=3014558 RepID=UPI0022B5AC04|nr:hypothetical protein [Streptomyces sp. ActVer]MCZ4507915.1 hypothetical protein [Streptomyces sp. ActVer]
MRDLYVATVSVRLAGSEFHESTDAESGFGRVAERPVKAEGVLIAPSDPSPAQVAAFLEVGHDSLDGALGDLAGNSQIPQPRARLTCDGCQHPRVMGQDSPSPVWPMVQRPSLH